MQIIKPKKLNIGDMIGVVAPANSARFISRDNWNLAVSRFEGRGFNLKFGKHINDLHGHTAGTAKERADDLMAMFLDKDVKAIMAIYGGYNSHQLLEYLDFEAIKANPKIFIGFSDVTSLNNALFTKAGLVNFSGPAFVTFTQPDLPEFTERYFNQFLLEGKNGIQIEPSDEWADDAWWQDEVYSGRKWKENPGWNILKSGRAEGVVIGGNVGTMLLLAGTPYWPDLDGKILFVEDDEEESTQTIDRYFTQLRQMGVYDKIKGMVIGRFPSSVGFKDGDSLKMIIDDALRGYDMPIISEVDFAHTDPLITFPIGCRCSINTDAAEIRFLEAGVTD